MLTNLSNLPRANADPAPLGVGRKNGRANWLISPLDEGGDVGIDDVTQGPGLGLWRRLGFVGWVVELLEELDADILSLGMRINMQLHREIQVHFNA